MTAIVTDPLTEWEKELLITVGSRVSYCGDEGKVVEIDTDQPVRFPVGVKWDNATVAVYYRFDELEFVANAPVYAEGDRVVVDWVSPEQWANYGFMIGIEGTVVELNDHDSTFDVRFDNGEHLAVNAGEISPAPFKGEPEVNEGDDCECCFGDEDEDAFWEDFYRVASQPAPVDVLHRPMSSSDLSEAVRDTVWAVRDRIEGVGAEQYAEGEGQRFESMKVSDLLEMAREEVQDLVAYAVMTDIRLARIQAAISGEGL